MVHYDIWMRKYMQKRESIVESLRDVASQVKSIRGKIPVESIIKPLDLPKPSLSSGMCFVDGGEGLRETMGAGVYFVRASALYMADEKASGEFNRDLDLGVIAYDDYTKERVEFLRETLESKVALDCVKAKKPKFVFMDGSLYVKSQAKKIECPEFFAMSEALERFFEAAKMAGALVCGVSEDSKSRILKRHLESRYGVSFPSFMTDPTILEMISPYETYMTSVLTPKKGALSYPTAYMKPTPSSNPMRVDVAPWVTDASEVFAVVSELSKSSRAYGFPLPLYLAHLDSVVPKKQADWSTRRIVEHAFKSDDKLGGAVFGQTRRDRRPE